MSDQTVEFSDNVTDDELDEELDAMTDDNVTDTTNTPEPIEVDDTTRGLVLQYKGVVESANDIVRRVNASGDKAAGKILSDLRENSDDETVTQFRAVLEEIDRRREEAITKIDAYIKANLMTETVLSPEEQEKCKAQYNDLSKRAKAGATWLESMPNIDAIYASLGVPSLLSYPGTRSGSGSGRGEGGKKPRLAHATINGEPFSAVITNSKGEKVEKVSFTLLAQELVKRVKDSGHKGFTLTANDLQTAAFATAKTDDLSKVSEVEFAVTLPDSNAMVRVWPAKSE